MNRALGAILLGLLLVVAAPAAAQTFPALSGRVVDQANVIPDDREAALVQRLEQLQRQSSRQLVIATIASLEGYPIEDYGYRLGRHWRIGQSEANNGIILIVAPNERRVRIEVGYGLEPIMTDALSHQIVTNEVLPRFRENDYPGGIEAGANAIITQLAAPPEAAERAAIEAEQRRAANGGDGGFPFEIIVWLVILGFFVVPMIVNAVSPRRRRRRRRYGEDVIPWGVGWGGGSSSSSWGGSSWGGGGSSWGGGGGGFSGGGGSFGGGGASGGW